MVVTPYMPFACFSVKPCTLQTIQHIEAPSITKIEERLRAPTLKQPLALCLRLSHLQIQLHGMQALNHFQLELTKPSYQQGSNPTDE